MRNDVVYAVALGLAAATLVYFFVPLSLVQTGQKAASGVQNITFDDRMKKFMEDNPGANESYARDVVNHDMAIESKNSSLCGEISDETLRKDCSFYFQVASR